MHVYTVYIALMHVIICPENLKTTEHQVRLYISDPYPGVEILSYANCKWNILALYLSNLGVFYSRVLVLSSYLT